MKEGVPEHGRELYPFLYGENGGATGARLAAVLETVRQSTLQKAEDIAGLRNQILREYANTLVEAAFAMSRAFARGGQLLAFGNGGSATDAQDAAADCVSPPRRDWQSLAALALTDDVGVVTAVANDVGFEHVFLRQVVAFGTPGDIALAFSTSGSSPSIVKGLEEARARGLVTVALVGGDGGAVARSTLAQHCVVVRHDFLPRIQEAHATLWHTLLELVQHQLSREQPQ